MKLIENRIPPPLVALLCGALMWAITLYTPPLTISAGVRGTTTALLLLLGMAFSTAGVVSFRRAKTTVNPLQPDTASNLVTSGIYRVTRNPMYVGMALALCAWAVYLCSAWAVAGVVVFILFIHRFQIRPEETALETIFGQVFTDYKNRVRPWL